MNKVFTQPTGPVAKQTNKQAIARIFGIKQNQVGYLSQFLNLDDTVIVYEPVSQKSFWLADASGAVTSWSVIDNKLSLVTSNGTYLLNQAMAGDYITIPDLVQLKKFEPYKAGQTVLLQRAVSGGPVINELMYYNPLASDMEEDGYSRFVTEGGKVWDADISRGHNIFLAGYSESADNFAQCWNKIISHKVAKIVERGYVAGGVGSHIRIPPNPNEDGITVFRLTESVRHPSFISSYLPEACILDASSYISGVPLICSNEFTGLTQTMMFLNNGAGWGSGAGASSGHTSGGIFGKGTLLKGPNTDSNPELSPYPGIRWGNVSYPSSYAHYRDANLFDLTTSGFAEGMRIASVDTYLSTITHCYFTKNGVGIATNTNLNGSTYEWSNSGEKMMFINCVIGDNRKHALQMNSRGHFLIFRDCSFDYNAQDLLYCSPTNLGKVLILGGHIEGNGGMFLNCPTRTTSDGENNLKIAYAQIYVNKGVGDPYSGVRTIAYATTVRTILELDNCDIYCRNPYVNGAYSSWKAYDPTNLARVIIRYPGSGQTYRFLPSYDGTFGNRVNTALLFNGTAGANVPTGQSTGDFHCIKTGSAQCVYGSSADADSDGVIPIKITLTAPTESVQLLLSLPVYPDRASQYIHGFCSVKANNAVGAVNVTAIARAIKSVTGSVTAAPGSVTNTEVLAGINSSTTQDILASLNQSNISITKQDFMGTRPLATQMSNGIYSYIGFMFTGFTGDIYVKLPVWMFSDRQNNFGYI